MTLRPYQQEAHDAIISWIRKNTTPCCIEAATGCHEIGHPILMFDGSIKPVQNVIVGDQVMGPDSKPRTVVRLHCGRDTMYRTITTKGERFSVNAGHVFSLYTTPKKAGQMPGYREVTAAYIYSAAGPTEKHVMKLQRVAVDFPEASQVVPAWIVGALIGDGSLTAGTPSFCTMDPEVVDGVSSWAETLGCYLVKHGKEGDLASSYNIVDPISNRSTENRCRAALKEIGIYGCYAGDKFVPKEYIVASRAQRLDVLAGLIDTDGYMTRAGYDWISKSMKLADDITFLCRSVGLAAYVQECTKGYGDTFRETYYRVSISGDCSVIPCRVPRRVAPPRQQIKRVDVTGFALAQLDVGSYYGFELDGDHLYLDGYFIRHHNSGKSHIISAVADTIHTMSKGKHVLCLAPSAELVKQNAEKFKLAGAKCSIFSASAGEKSLRHPVVFGTPGTVINAIERFGSQFAAVVIDEAHGITPTVKSIIEKMKLANPNLRVIGLSATPYRMGTGYIFGFWPDGKPVPETKAKDPYFEACVYRVQAYTLIEQGFLTQPTIGKPNVDGYKTLDMQLNARGQFDTTAIDRAYHGQGRKTSAIIADVISQAQFLRGVMIFAATVKHAKECMESLPEAMSALVTGETDKKDRDKIIRDFKAGKVKYLVNVSVLTTGFDAAHVEMIAILRATESVGLLQQVIGRGLRVEEFKDTCLILDYAENLTRHCPGGDVFNPKVEVTKGDQEETTLNCVCPLCDVENEFTPRPNKDGYEVDENGYFLDLDGQRVQSDWGHIPAHYGRRCGAKVTIAGERIQCTYRWTFKPCPHCGAENDIAARYCTACKGEIVDPNDKLKLDFKAMKKDPTQKQTDNVVTWTKKSHVARSGKETWKIDVVTDYRSFSYWIMKEPKTFSGMKELEMLTDLGDEKPKTISYQLDPISTFYRVFAYGNPPDVAPE